MWKATISGILARKVRLALTALAVVLGVTFVSGTYVLTDTLEALVRRRLLPDGRAASTSWCGAERAVRAGSARPAAAPRRPGRRRARGRRASAAADGFLHGYAQFVGKDGRQRSATASCRRSGSRGAAGRPGSVPARDDGQSRRPVPDGRSRWTSGPPRRNGFQVGDRVTRAAAGRGRGVQRSSGCSGSGPSSTSAR